jgi:hypothetical protein
MKAQALVFPKPQTAATARRKASKLTGRKVNPCLPPEGSGMPGEESVEVMVNPKRAPKLAAFSIPDYEQRLRKIVAGEGRRSRGRAYRAGIINGLVSASMSFRESAAGTWQRYFAEAFDRTARHFAREWHLAR